MQTIYKAFAIIDHHSDTATIYTFRKGSKKDHDLEVAGIGFVIVTATIAKGVPEECLDKERVWVGSLNSKEIESIKSADPVNADRIIRYLNGEALPGESDAENEVLFQACLTKLSESVKLFVVLLRSLTN